MNKNPPDPWVLIGRIGKPVGLRGSIRVWSEAELDTIFEKQVPLVLWDEESEPKFSFRMAEVVRDAKGWIVQVEEVGDRESAADLTNALLVARREDLPVPDSDLVYWSDLVGAEVVTKEGEPVGRIKDLSETPSSTLIEVEAADGVVFLVPLTEEVDADLEIGKASNGGNRVSVHVPEGMREATTLDRDSKPKPAKKRLRPKRRKRT